jgi:hypothetical protein
MKTIAMARALGSGAAAMGGPRLEGQQVDNTDP